MTTFKSPLEGALYCAKRGLHVFPLCRKEDVDRGKRSSVKDPAVGLMKWYDRASTDENTIRAWATSGKHNGCGWGVAVANSGLIALDLDTKEAHGNDGLAAFNEWKKTVPFPPTFTVRTPSGGLHLYYKATGIGNPKPRRGIEVKGFHGYVVAPGTAINGKQYEVIDDREPADLPAEANLQKMPSKDAAPAVTGSASVGSSDDFAIILSDIAALQEGHFKSGGRDDALAKIGFEWNERGMGVAARLELFRLLDRLGLIEQPKGDVKGDADFIRINGSIERNKKDKFGTKTLASMFGKKWVGADEIEAADLPEPELLIDGLLGSGLSLLSGPPKLGKTNMLLQVGYALAKGEDFLGHKVTAPKRVLIGYLEGNESQVKKRMRLLNGPDYKAPKDLKFFFSIPPLDKGGLEAIRAMIEEVHPDVIAFDVLQKIRCINIPKGLNAYERDYREFDFIRRNIVEQYGVSVILTHHNKKGDPKTSDSEILSGSIGISGSVDTQLTLKGRPQDSAATLSVQGRDVEAVELKLVKKEPLGWELDTNGPILIPKGKTQVAVYGLLEKHREGLTTGEMARMLYGKESEGAIKSCVSRWSGANPPLIGKTGSKYWLFRTEEEGGME